MDEARSVRDSWFGPLPLSADALNRRLRFWFGDEGSELRQKRDAQIHTRFGALFERAVSGQLMTLRPLCRSYQRRSSASQRPSDRRATASAAAATSTGPASRAHDSGAVAAL